MAGVYRLGWAPFGPPARHLCTRRPISVQNFGALAVHSLNAQGDLQCRGQVGEVSCAFLYNLPGLFVACDDAHETDPFAPGMATSTDRGERGRVTGSECSAARFGIISTAAPGGEWQP